MKVLIDRNSLQSSFHFQDQLRLSSFLSDAHSKLGAETLFSVGDDLSKNSLTEIDVIVILTRYLSQGGPGYSNDEINAIETFIISGGGLLLMSNHADLPGHNPHDLREHDQVLAERFGVTIERFWVAGVRDGGPTEINGGHLRRSHPVISGGIDYQPVSSVVVNNCSAIRSAPQHGLISYPPSMREHRTGISLHGVHFAVALEPDKYRHEGKKGRVIVTANSGFVGTTGTSKPGPGLYDLGDNSQFALNCIRWLANEI